MLSALYRNPVSNACSFHTVDRQSDLYLVVCWCPVWSNVDSFNFAGNAWHTDVRQMCPWTYFFAATGKSKMKHSIPSLGKFGEMKPLSVQMLAHWIYSKCHSLKRFWCENVWRIRRSDVGLQNIFGKQTINISCSHCTTVHCIATSLVIVSSTILAFSSPPTVINPKWSMSHVVCM